jgi:signal transduction histidine kinase
MGRVVAARVAEAQASRSDGELRALLDAQIGAATGLYGISLFDLEGALITSAGDPEVTQHLPPGLRPGDAQVRAVQTRHGRALEVVVPGRKGAVLVVLRTDDEVARAGPLVRMVGLYMLLVALALLVLVYFLLTRLVVQPLDALSLSARRVAAGNLRLEVPAKGPAELIDVGASLSEMTLRLREEEEQLRHKVAELEKATADLRAAQDQLVRSERLASVGRLAAGLAHEVGNPLAALMGLQDLLIDGGLDRDEERDFLARMRRETERIHRILRDLLDFARPTARSTDREEHPGSLRDAIDEVLRLLRPQPAMREISIEVSLEDGLPAVQLGHERLVQVLLNLVGNAGDAAGPGGHIWLTARREGSEVRLDVDDDGPGIDPAIAPQLFEPFVTTKDVGKGTGLGLAVCRGLVEGAGGSIHAGSRPDGQRGARLTVRTPVSRGVSLSG